VNDKRFLPSYTFAGPEKPGRVVVVLTAPCQMGGATL
jgi:hypothetical protein